MGFPSLVTAFSFFAFCEYLIASANMGFHWTCTLDFPTEDFLIANSTDSIRQLYEGQFKSDDTTSKGGGQQQSQLQGQKQEAIKKES